MDLYLFNLINQFALKWFWLDTLAIFFAAYFQYVLIFCLLVFLVFNFKKYFKITVLAIIAGIFSRFFLVGLIRLFWQRSRPFIANNVNLLFEHNGFSFPSGHAAFFFAVSGIVYLFNKKVGLLFFIASFLICLARVFSGVHWPSDILAGAVVGIFSAWLFYKIFQKIASQLS